MPSTPDAAASTAERVIFEGRPAALDSLGRWLLALLTLGLAALYFWFDAAGRRFKITNQRLVLKTGVLSVRTDFVELYRITDLDVEEPLFERMLGYGRLVIASSDRSDPTLVLRGIQRPEALADQLRACIEEQKRARSVTTIAQA